MAKFMITSIEWETDGEEVSLPTEEIVDGADDGDAAVDALSDKYGWLIKNCSVEEFKDRELIAQLICGRGQCYCAYDCGHSNKPSKDKLGPFIGTETVCPLAKFHVTPDTRPWYELLGEPSLTQQDCWNFCAQCDHASVSEDGTVTLKDFETACLDCPVKAVLDNIQECEAEF